MRRERLKLNAHGANIFRMPPTKEVVREMFATDVTMKFARFMRDLSRGNGRFKKADPHEQRNTEQYTSQILSGRQKKRATHGKKWPPRGQGEIRIGTEAELHAAGKVSAAACRKSKSIHAGVHPLLCVWLKMWKFSQRNRVREFAEGEALEEAEVEVDATRAARVFRDIAKVRPVELRSVRLKRSGRERLRRQTDENFGATSRDGTGCQRRWPRGRIAKSGIVRDADWRAGLRNGDAGELPDAKKRMKGSRL